MIMSTINGTSRTFHVPGYQVVRLLGTGAHSTIWEVRDMQTQRPYAIKRVVKNDKTDDRFIQQAVNEYEVAQRIDHPNVRKIYKLRKIRKLFSVRELHLLMEFCPGRNAQDDPPKSVLDVCVIFAQVANAMHRINKSGFVHADMKPSNVIVDLAGNVKIVDLGHSCPVGTVKVRIQGTPDYIAPEQVQRMPLDARTDVFNFGASVYWSLTGKPGPIVLPQAGSLQIPGHNQVKPPHELNPEAPPMLSRLVMDCIQLQPADRPANMQEVVTRMGLVLQRELAPVSE